MKNIHVLPANKPSSLYFSGNNSELLFLKGHIFYRAFGISPQNIYITSNEEIKEGLNQWYLDKLLNKPRNSSGSQYGEKQDVIILTDNKDLIKDGVQAIDDEFLEWFVKNPSCEFVEVVDDWNSPRIDAYEYKIIIPKEEPKQETLEEAIDRISKENGYDIEGGKVADFVDGMVKGAKWQQEQICTSEFIQRIRATKSDAEARRIIREQFKN